MTAESPTPSARSPIARVPPLVWLLALVTAVAAVLLTGLAQTAPVRASEQRCLEVSRGILASGDWIVPQMDGRPRLHKPPLYYWLGAASGELLGGLDAFALRLPSVAAALLLVVLAFVWGRSLRGDSFGLLCGLVLASMVLLYTQGRRGDAETTLALTAGAALFCFDRIHYGGRHLLPAFAVLLALAFLAKATAALLVVGLPILVVLLLEGGLRRALRPAVVGWLLVALLLGMTWYLAVFALVPGGFRLVVDEALLPLGRRVADSTAAHFRGPFYLLLRLPGAVVPAALLLPVLAWRAWRTRGWREQPRVRFVGICFLAVFLAFSAIPQKQKHYLTGMLLPLAVLLADSLAALLAGEHRERALRALAVATAVAGALVGLGAAAYLAYAAEVATPLWIGVAGVCLVAAAPLLRRTPLPPPPRLAAAHALVLFIALLVYYGSFRPVQAYYAADPEYRQAQFDHSEWEERFARRPLLRLLFPADPQQKEAEHASIR